MELTHHHHEVCIYQLKKSTCESHKLHWLFHRLVIHTHTFHLKKDKTHEFSSISSEPPTKSICQDKINIPSPCGLSSFSQILHEKSHTVKVWSAIAYLTLTKAVHVEIKKNVSSHISKLRHDKICARKRQRHTPHQHGVDIPPQKICFI